MRWASTEFGIGAPVTGAATGDRDSDSGGVRRQRPDGTMCGVVINQFFGLMSRQIMART